MILHQYLIDHKIQLDKKTESKLGEIISNQYRDKYSDSAPKIIVEGMEGELNNYPSEFLKSCEELIIQFLNPTPENQIV